jgi:hypothetical protein
MVDAQISPGPPGSVDQHPVILTGLPCAFLFRHRRVTTAQKNALRSFFYAAPHPLWTGCAITVETDGLYHAVKGTIGALGRSLSFLGHTPALHMHNLAHLS